MQSGALAEGWMARVISFGLTPSSCASSRRSCGRTPICSNCHKLNSRHAAWLRQQVSATSRPHAGLKSRPPLIPMLVRRQQRSRISYPCPLDDVDGEARPLVKDVEHESFMGKISRRLMMRNFVTYGAAAEITYGALAAIGSVQAASKVAPKIVGYQSKPMGKAECANCINFEAPSSCKVVEGVIAPTGWCRLYAQRESSG